MSRWPSSRTSKVLAALVRIGWIIKRQSGTSHRVLARPGWPDYTFAFHEGEEIGQRCWHGLLNIPVLLPKTYKKKTQH